MCSGSVLVHRYKWTCRLDYSCIGTLLVGAYSPMLYYGFICEPFWQRFYLSSFLLLGMLGMVMSFLPAFSTPQYTSFRTGTRVQAQQSCGAWPSDSLFDASQGSFLRSDGRPWCLYRTCCISTVRGTCGKSHDGSFSWVSSTRREPTSTPSVSRRGGIPANTTSAAYVPRAPPHTSPLMRSH